MQKKQENSSNMYVPALKLKYTKEVVPMLQKELGFSTPMEVPKIVKICINQGVGHAVQNPKEIEKAVEELTLIAGQKAVPTRAKKAISNFKLRKGVEIGARVTLRGNRMYEFLERLIHLSIPKIRDFGGLKDTHFDKQGNYTLGIEEKLIFPEIEIDKVSRVNGLSITIVTSKIDKKGSLALFRALGMPIVGENTNK